MPQLIDIAGIGVVEFPDGMSDDQIVSAIRSNMAADKMPTIQKFRQQYPQYSDMSDTALADALHSKFYSDMPKAVFNSKIGLDQQRPEELTLDQQKALAMAAARQRMAEAEPKSGGEVAADVAKSGGIGVVKGGIGLAGLIGDASEYGARGLDVATRYVGNQLGYNIPERPNQEPFGGSAQIQRGVESVTGPLYEPKTTAGQYAQALGEFAPAIAAGPGGLVRKAALNVALPAVASETAGQVTEGTQAEPYARLAGALLGTGAGIKAGGAIDRAAARAATPTAQDLKSAATSGYDAAKNSGIELKPSSIQDFTARVQGDLVADGINDIVAPNTFRILDRVGNPTGTVTTNDYRTMQRALGHAAKSPDPTERLAASRAITALNDHIENLPASDLLRGTPADAAAVSQTIKEANANYKAYKQSENFNLRADRAENNAAAGNSGMNLENQLRSQVRQILNNPKLQRGLDAETLGAMKQFNRGVRSANVLRAVGNLLGGGGGIGMGLSGGAGFMLGGPVGAVLAPAAGYATKAIGNALARNKFDALGEMIRSKSPLAEKLMPKKQPSRRLSRALMSGLLATTGGR